MKTPTNQNSAFKSPLTEILSSRGHILVLRQLVQLKSSTSHGELMSRTDMSRQGTYDVVGRMVKNGIVKYAGSGKKQLVEFNMDHPMAKPIIHLFEAEKERFDSFIKKLKDEIKTLETEPKSAWIFGKVANGTDEYGDPVRIALLGDVKSVDEMTESFRKKLYEANIEQNYDVTIDVRGVTLADEAALNTHNIIMIWGSDPQFYLAMSKDDRRTVKSHEEFDKQSLIDSKAWTELLKKHPEIISRTINFLEEHLTQNPSGVDKELGEWKHILESMSHQRLKKFLESDSERAVRLRQSLPFWQVLNEKERELLKEITD